MDRLRARYFLQELRGARARALGDAEGFMEVVRVLERLGAYEHGLAGSGFGDYRKALGWVAEHSPLASETATCFPNHHIPFERLFQLVRLGRNDAAHQGAYARHLTVHAIELALMLEDALMIDLFCAGDLMVSDPVQAMPWHPISFARQKMLLNSYSFLPLYWEKDAEKGWRLLSDRSVASYLRARSDNSTKRDLRRHRLHVTVEDAVLRGELALERANTCPPTTPVDELATKISDTPYLVIDSADSLRLIGIITAFDLL